MLLRSLYLILAAIVLTAGPCHAGMPAFECYKPDDPAVESTLRQDIAMQEKRQHPKPVLIAWMYQDLSRVLEIKGATEDAEALIKKSTDLVDRIQPFWGAIIFQRAGYFYYRHGRYDKAASQADSAIATANRYLVAGAGDDSGRSGWPTVLDTALSLKVACLFQMHRPDDARHAHEKERNFVASSASTFVRSHALSWLKKSGDEVKNCNPDDYLSGVVESTKIDLMRNISLPPDPPGYDFCAD